MLKAKRLIVEITLNDAGSLLAYLGLLGEAMKDKKSELYHAFDGRLSAADWQGAARCLEPLKQAIERARRQLTPK
jgi:hypothetical protein